jgi:hypothetical protein
VAQLFVKNNANIYIETITGLTVHAIATQKGQQEIIELLKNTKPVNSICNLL